MGSSRDDASWRSFVLVVAVVCRCFSEAVVLSHGSSTSISVPQTVPPNVSPLRNRAMGASKVKRTNSATSAANAAAGSQASAAFAGPRGMNPMLPRLLAVTGFWVQATIPGQAPNQAVGTVRHPLDLYLEQMQYVMSLNVPLAIYGDDEGLRRMQESRQKSGMGRLVGATRFLVQDLEPCRSHGLEMLRNKDLWIKEKHQQNIAVGCIWDGKVSLLSHAAASFPFYDFYAWIDVGMHASLNFRSVFTSHGSSPWPAENKLLSLSRVKITVSQSNHDCHKLPSEPFEPLHCIAGTSYVVPKVLLGRLHMQFYKILSECYNFWKDGHKHVVKLDEPSGENGIDNGGYACLSDQIILSQLWKRDPTLFTFTTKNGYGAVAANLTTPALRFAKGKENDQSLFEYLWDEDTAAQTDDGESHISRNQASQAATKDI